MEKVYVLTETDSTDSSWCYNEVFASKESAEKRLEQLYEENVVALEDAIEYARLEDDFACAVVKDANVISWNIRECEIQ